MAQRGRTAEGNSASRQVRAGRTEQGRRRVRAELAVLALDLFASRGYDATTVDQIAEAAGVGRRTFFRYFRSKEDVVFPDHDERLAEVVRVLEGAAVDADPLEVVERAAQIVLDMYLVEPELSVKRFDLTRSVSSLRDKEIASIDRYQRVFARYLRGRLPEREDRDLRAAVAAAAVVAAHNQVLREWLRADGVVDARDQLRTALRWVREALVPAGGSGDHEFVVGVVRATGTATEVRDRIEQALQG